ncbi:GatB/YqeY domain-containing protein [Sulfurimonas sp.]|uniref:GatB/YqeY domain-containing protein n=1 Tax=Sulfurimonas sp. TaxID=2022749 RepID=UPI002AB1F17F|nr:GatB/YqeY domain-containing protein [Sulfurimonas sp.]
MTLREIINQDIKDAMKAKETKKRDALRLLTSAFKQIEVDERRVLSDDDIIKIIQTQVKRRNDAASQFKDASRDDLVKIELDEIAIYTPYLPAQLDDEELASSIAKIISILGASTMKDMGKVMGKASKELAGKADGKRISECVKDLLK